MTKQQIRVSMQGMNRNVNKLTSLEVSNNIFSQIENNPIFATSHTIALYVALPDEVPTNEIIERWHKMGKEILLPRIESDDIIEFYLYTSKQQLIQGRFNILEPQRESAPYEPYKIDLMILPGVAFSSDGGRLGRGRGYYDRYLAQPGFAAYTVGVCYPHQLLDSIPCEDHDIKLNEVVSHLNDDIKSTPETIPSIILSVIEAAGVDANRLGCGVNTLNRTGLSWVLLNITIEILKAPSNGEKIDIETWISGCNRVSSTRDFILYNQQGDRIGTASTNWCMIDLNTRRAVNLTAAEINYSQHVQDRPSEISIERRLPTFDPEQPLIESTHLATERDIDFNNHVNTIRYIEMMLETMPQELQQRVAKTRTSLNFVSESRLGDLLTIKKQEQLLPNGKQSLFEIVHSDSSVSVKGLFRWFD